MKKKILMLCMGCFLVSLTAKAHAGRGLAVEFQSETFPCNSGMRMTSKYSGYT